MNDVQLLNYSLLTLVISWLFIVVLPTEKKAIANSIFIFINALLTSIPALNVINGNEINLVYQNVGFFGDIPLQIDSLSAWFILIINFTCLTGAVYGIGYMKQYSGQKKNLTMHWVVYMLFHSSMIWVCVVQNSLIFLVIWELMSLSSLLLVIYDHQNGKTLKAGINYLIQMHIGVVFLTVAFLWIYFSTGSYNFQSAIIFFNSNSNIWLFMLLFAGFGIKAGFIPLHSWLPHAHPAAPSHISGVMSGVIVKMGIFGILRFALMLKSELVLIGELLIIISILTGIFGIINSAVHRDFKKMLAYCTIENIGIIGIGIGLMLVGMGTNNSTLIIMGLCGALLHSLNHSLFKSLLFFNAGSIYSQTHTLDMEKLGGLVKKMPQTAVLYLIGSLAIGGLPPFNGFVSEFLIYNGFLNGVMNMKLIHSTLMILSLAGLVIIGGLSLLTFTKSFSAIFLGTEREHLHYKPSEVSLIMRIPQYFIVAVMLTIGIFPQFYFSIVMKITNSMLPAIFSQNQAALLVFPEVLSKIGLCSFLFIILTFLLLLIRYLIVQKRSFVINSTWGCGYISSTNKMQYTGKSFSKTLGKLFGFIVMEKKQYSELTSNEIFPETRNHSSHYVDFFEQNIFDTVINRLIHFFGYFRFFQNGKIQMYVLYGVFFIVIVFVGTLFGLI